MIVTKPVNQRAWWFVLPVLVSVAAIFCPTLPDFPMPTTTTLERALTASIMASTAASND